MGVEPFDAVKASEDDLRGFHRLADRPDVDRFQTATSAHNVPMRRVNEALGYRTVRTFVAVNQEVA
ncbi:hypothetical protein Lesp02_09430 [Lentzea sp. NBRC 105346]|uniref:hypothetical protein n=1 Tax=Lentzea sp. NBRC 105346 TaxID=3032205 RepID=UPI0024A0F2AF|nr:hypothetical protein [Lentzea sp. NBRC 105346]GLZ28753.1 hypothetical protein Lesp02_09430 [Lentzea sp. NBRC 105346]